MSTRAYRHLLVAAAALAISGCGGGGGGVNSLPKPPVNPTPTPTPAPTPTPSAGVPIDILQTPATQEFAALTSSGSVSGLAIRFDAATGIYEVLVDAQWQGLRPSATYTSTPQQYFDFGPSTADGQSFFQVAATAATSPPNAYQYSSLAVWGKGVGAYWDDLNFTAFGVATAQSAVPVTGSASYQGIIAGDTDILETDFLIGTEVAATITGTVALDFDFGAGSLSGSLSPTLWTFAGQTDLPTLAFVDTVYGVGSTTYSGRFDTSLAGANAFEGLFTGPSAEESIGRWVFPFTYPATGTIHSASGAWIARR